MYQSILMHSTGVALTLIMCISFQNTEMISAFASSENFTLSDAKIKKMDRAISSSMQSEKEINQNGSSGALGVAIISDKGFESVIAATTHMGVYDSLQQKDASDPVWHNHFVKLVSDNSNGSKCGNNPQVKDLTLQSPGNVSISNQSMELSGIPTNFNSTSSLSNSTIAFEMGKNIDKVVTFKLEPKFDSENNVEVVWVTNIQPVGNLTLE
jgi:hypothetical protein